LTGKSKFNFLTTGASFILLLIYKFGFWFYFYITWFTKFYVSISSLTLCDWKLLILYIISFFY
jgi:hypothetical protein